MAWWNLQSLAWVSIGAQARCDCAPVILVAWELEEMDKRDMKVCAYCGRHNEDNATQCSECATLEFKSVDDAATEFVGRKWKFGVLSKDQMEHDFVTLLTCRTLAEAD